MVLKVKGNIILYSCQRTLRVQVISYRILSYQWLITPIFPKTE